VAAYGANQWGFASTSSDSALKTPLRLCSGAGKEQPKQGWFALGGTVNMGVK